MSGRRVDAGALILIALGGIGLSTASDYGLGEPDRIGPGVFPVAVSILLTMSAAGIAVGRPPHRPRPALAVLTRTWAAITGSLLAFALLLPIAGLIPAAAALATLASLARRPLNLRGLLSAFAIAAACGLILTRGLGIGVPLFPW